MKGRLGAFESVYEKADPVLAKWGRSPTDRHPVQTTSAQLSAVVSQVHRRNNPMQELKATLDVVCGT